MPDRPKRFRLRYVVPVLTVLIAGLFSVLGKQIYNEVSALRSAPRDNIQWTLAQLEIELLTFMSAARDAEAKAEPDAALLKEARKRFDIFYSRAKTIRVSSAFQSLRALSDAESHIEAISETLEQSIPIIDGDDASLYAGLPALRETYEALRPTARTLSLEGVRVFAVQSDLNRSRLAVLLFQTASIGLLLILALVGSFAIVYRQHRVAERRAEIIRQSHARYASAINSSLDAIIVADADGVILDFSPAAEMAFGYSRATAVGSTVGEMMVPPKQRQAHRDSMERFLRTGEPHLVGAGRFEIDAMHASGILFPVEMSIGVSEGDDGKPIFIAFVRDISARREVQRELTSARDQALAADKAKSQFLAVMSHEMRTPLNGVMAILDLLSGSKLDDRQQQLVETAITSGEILQHHIDDVLDITRIEAGAIDIHPTRFDLPDLLDEVRRSHEIGAKARGNAIACSIVLAKPRVKLDRNRLRQILLNLVGNAVKFTESGAITVAVSESYDQDGRRRIEIKVSDTGVGISEGNLRRIFDDFVTLDSSYQRGAEGYGLGLAICRRIAAAMDGTITVESELGKGSTFTVSIPEAELATSSEEETDAPEKESGRSRRNFRVLVVEDNETNRFVAQAMLEEEGCTVTQAVDGGDGIAKADEARFDIILMDISMPNIDGLEATRRIRAGSGPSRKSRIVLLTAHVMDNEEDVMRELGVHDYLLKPLRRRNLVKVLERLDVELEEEDPADESEDNVILDEEVFRELASLMPKDRLEVAVGIFRAESAQIGDRLTDAIERGDFAAARDVAHKHAGSAAMFGAVSLAEVLRLAQDLAAEERGEDLKELIAEIGALERKSVLAIRDMQNAPAAEEAN